jgi:hypothetical protein
MDLSTLSTDELLKLRSQLQPAPAPAGPDLGAMSMEQLMAMRDQMRGANAAPTIPTTPEEVVKRERAELLFENPRAFEAQTPGLARRAVQGMTMNFADEALAALATPIEMAKRRTLDPREAYRYAKAQEDQAMAQAREQQGLAGTAAEVAGSVASGLTVARAAQAAPAAASKLGQLAQYLLGGTRNAAAGLPARVGSAAASGATYGAVAGAGEGNTLDERAKSAALGGVVGGAAGGGLQAAGEALRPLGAQAMARANPRAYAERQLARGVAESGQSADDITRQVAEANAAGQPFTVADAMGNAGQRQLSTVARNPGAGRQQVVEFLDGRQAEQGRRVATILSEGLDANATAAQSRAAQTAARREAADINYGAARDQAGAVDPTAAIRAADEFLQPGATGVMRPQTAIADDSVEAAVRRARGYLTDGKSILTDFEAARRAKIELDGMIESARGTVQRQLIPIRNALDDALASASPPYARARDTFRAQSKAIEAVDTGREIAKRGRMEDTIPTFRAMSPEEQASARIGYADQAIEKVQGAAIGTNKAREFTADATRAKLQAMAPLAKGAPMGRALDRENIMFATRNQALGGSKTADNLADDAAMGINPEIIGNLLAGNIGTAAKNALFRSGSALGGNTDAVRQEMARLLLSRGGADDIGQLLERSVSTERARRELIAALMRGGYAGTGTGVTQPRK